MHGLYITWFYGDIQMLVMPNKPQSQKIIRDTYNYTNKNNIPQINKCICIYI